MTGLRVVLAADEAAGARALNLLVRSDHEIVAVAGRASRADRAGSLWARASDLGVPSLDARRLSSADTADELADLEPDVLLNVHSLPKVCTEVLAVFAVGAWNLHPGPLPEAAGLNVPNWAIALGRSEHGVTVHRMTADYDEGDISYEDRFPIAAGATGLTLSAECGSRGLLLIKQLIDQLAVDPAGVPRLAQDLSLRGFHGVGQPNDGVIDWATPSQAIEAHVRAADFRPFESPWRPPRAQIDGQWFELFEVAIGEVAGVEPGVVSRTDGQLDVATGDRWLRINEAKEL